MIVPEYWAEARLQERIAHRNVTIRRFGWSDVSQEEAQANAEKRAQDAMMRIRAGAKVPRYEPRLAYNGAEGVPIREEIVSRHGTSVITRNLYGARCLNTPDVLFADIDFQQKSSLLKQLGFGAAHLFLALAGYQALHYFESSRLGVFLAMVLPQIILLMIRGAVSDKPVYPNKKKEIKLETEARKKLAAFLSANPDWHVRLYRTPAGLRVLAMHCTFDPGDPAVAAFFKAISTDPIYVRMCLHQKCFRARVSPKPWRVGIQTHIRPRPGVWPINPERMKQRQQWVEAYERTAKGHASCRFIEAIGSGRVTPETYAVQVLHDTLSQAQASLPLA